VAWLLCAILGYLSINPPRCEVCDDLSLVRSGSQPLAHQHTPTAPDTCNGLCSCCGLQGMPIANSVLMTMNLVVASAPTESPRPALTPLASIFRPPRTTLFS